MPPVLALYTKQFFRDKTLYIRLSRKQISENDWLGTDVLLEKRFIVRRSSPLNIDKHPMPSMAATSAAVVQADVDRKSTIWEREFGSLMCMWDI